MSIDEPEYRRLLCSMSLGYTAYHVWAAQARRERKYNVARLLEASSNVKRVRAEQAFRELGEVGRTPANIGRALAGLEPSAVATGPVTGTSAISRDLMSRAARALAEDRDLRAEELGDLFVCGSCGELIEGEAPPGCAVCGTVREGFLSFRAAEAMGTLGSSTLTRLMEQASTTLGALVDDLDDTQLSRRIGDYSLKQLVGHLADMDTVFRERAWLILETEKPQLPVAHPPTLERAAIYQTQPIGELLDLFATSRKQTLALLRGLTQAAWQRVGYHAIFGSIPLLHQGNWVVEHERGHLVEMAQMRHDLLRGSGQRTLPHSVIAEVLDES